jgi:hydroxymethylpyrimidine pyrophosphatase-like HAD family hydrolase
VNTVAGRLLAELRGRALPRERRMARWQAELGAFILQLAEYITGAGGAPSAARMLEIVARGRAALVPMQRAPRRLQRDVMRLPSCFRSFDQHPDDCRELAARFADRWPDRDVPLLVVGIRTSGSYLAPLLGAALRALGYARVEVMTMRPKQRWVARERHQVRAIAAAGGRALLVDDPPSTGRSVVRAARALALQGLPADRVSLMLALFGPLSSLPDCLRPYDTICLPFAEWAIHARLRPEVARSALANMLAGRVVQVEDTTGAWVRARVSAVEEVERVTVPHGGPLDGGAADEVSLEGVTMHRVHTRARYELRIADDSGRRYRMRVYATGIGAGYLGRYAEVAGEALSSYLPEAYGIHDGILYRAWLPEERRPIGNLPPGHADQPCAAAREAFARRIASYVAERQRMLAVREDVAMGLAGRGALWQHAGDLMALPFGRSAPFVRPVLYRAARRLLAPSASPSVVDGKMDLRHWFAPPDAPRHPDLAVDSAIKVATYDWAFSNLDHSCFDARYDIADAAAQYERHLAEDASYIGGDPTDFTRALVERFEALTGESIGEERLLLYRLLTLTLSRAETTAELAQRSARQAASSDREGCDDTCVRERLAGLMRARDAIETTLSRLHMRYMGDRFFRDISVPGSGPLCAIDIDGVLETSQLSFTAISPAGALGLRALARHGYRPVLATGRSLGDVKARCAAYRLAGGVAEYGAVVYDARTDQTRVLVGERDLEALDDLRAILCSIDGAFVDPAYRYCVRAYRLDDQGMRRSLDEATVSRVLALLAEAPSGEPSSGQPFRLQPVAGERQTDFTVAGIDKGTGLAALAALLGSQQESFVIRFAAGDSVSDLAMFHVAQRAYAPANADAAVYAAHRGGEPGLRIMPRAYQAGLLQAVADLLGHDPRRCATCRRPPAGYESELLLAALGAADRPMFDKLRQAWRLATILIPAPSPTEITARIRRIPHE